MSEVRASSREIAAAAERRAAPRRRRRPASNLWLDALLVVLVVLAGAFFYYRTNTGLHYQWNWSAIPEYLVRYDAQTQSWVQNILLKGFVTTIRLVIGSAFIAAAVGVAIAMLAVSEILLFRLVARAYVELIRNMPSLVFVFIFYFFISSQVMPMLGIDEMARNAPPQSARTIELLLGPVDLVSNLVAGVLCLAMLEAAYVAEIVRAGIQSIPKGQREAGRTLGLNRLAVMRFIVLPQALERVVPPLASQFILLVKASSIMSLISVAELTYAGSEIASSTGRIFEVWITVAGMYFALCFALSLLFRRLERRQALPRSR